MMPSDIGDNSGHRVVASELLGLIKGFEKLQEQKEDIAEGQKNIRSVAKGQGYNMTAFNEMLKLRKLDPKVREEREALRQLYADVLEMFG